MEEKHSNYIVRVALETTLSLSSDKPLTNKQLLKKLRSQTYNDKDSVEELESKFLYVISTEPVEKV